MVVNEASLADFQVGNKSDLEAILYFDVRTECHSTSVSLIFEHFGPNNGSFLLVF